MNDDRCLCARIEKLGEDLRTASARRLDAFYRYIALGEEVWRRGGRVWGDPSPEGFARDFAVKKGSEWQKDGPAAGVIRQERAIAEGTARDDELVVRIWNAYCDHERLSAEYAELEMKLRAEVHAIAYGHAREAQG